MAPLTLRTIMPANGLTPSTLVEHLTRFRGSDLEDLCDAADEAIRAGGGFGWVAPPPRVVMERFWKGVLAVPERTLFVGRLDGVIAGSVQLVRPSRNNEAQAHACTVTNTFVAAWARRRGLARAIVTAATTMAQENGFRVVNLDVRETQGAALALFESLGFQRWGTHPRYALVDGKAVAGQFYFLDLNPNPQAESPPQ
jgi:ribosomal protein S18 acetylase RimI-like enzyme